MKTTKERRDFIRNMVLAGFSLYLPACQPRGKHTLPQDENPAPPTNTQDKPEEVIEEEVEAIDEFFESENLVLLRANDDQYQELNVGFNLRVPKLPKIIALCKNIEGIAEAIKYANQFELQVCIKSGGHSFEGFSSNDGGMSINLSLMKAIEWVDDETVKMECGVILKEIYEALLPKGKIIPSGSCAGVGIAGLTLGGGYGLFSRSLGLTCDSLAALSMVDGQGNIHHAKGDDELMWACRGGGNGNFGVIANMTFKVHDAPTIFTRHLFKAFKLNNARAVALLEAWYTMTSQLPDSCFGAFVLNGKTLTVLVTDTADKTNEIRPVLDSFGSKMDRATIGRTDTDIAKALSRYYGIQTPLFFKNACAGLYKSFEDTQACISEVVQLVHDNPGLIYQVNTLGGKIHDAAFERQSSYPHRAFPYLGELQAYYEKPEKGEKLVSAFQQIQKIFTANGIRAHYRNYPDIDFQDWELAYYGSNYTRLQKVKRKYDPNNLIRHPQSIKA
jgi:hypothetical protein